MMKEQQTAIMKHLPEMEIIDSDLMNKVLALTQKLIIPALRAKMWKCPGRGSP